MLVAMPMGMIVPVRMIMGMIVAAVATLAVGVLVVVVNTRLAVFVVMTLRPMLMGIFVFPMIMIEPVGLAVTVGATLRIEGSQHRRYRGAETLQHVLDDVVVADMQPVAEELGGQVPVAKVPGDADEIGRVGRGDLKQPLGHRLHQDQPSVLEFESVAVLHYRRFLEIEQEYGLADATHDEAAAVAIVALKSERICRRTGPSAGRKDASGGDHGISALADEGSDGRTSLAKSAAEASAAAIKARPSSAAAATPAW